MDKNQITRAETDSFGPIEVPAERYWGAQTQRSRVHFAIGAETMPVEIIRALALVKRVAAEVNRDLRLLPEALCAAIAAAAREIEDGAPRRRISPPRLADGVRHPNQHERQ